MKNALTEKTGSFACAVGKGLVAGLIGTLVITLAQMIEKKITGDTKEDTKPADAVTNALNIQPTTPEQKPTFAREVHWTYGTLLGTLRGVISELGLKKLPASAVHFAAVSAMAMTILPSTKTAPSIKKWDYKTIAMNSLNHAIYATAAGLVYDAIDI